MQGSAQKCNEIGPFFGVVHMMYASFVYQGKDACVADSGYDTTVRPLT